MSYPRRTLLTMLLLFSSTGFAEQGVEAEAPSMELLEFLGEWITEEGEWVDPDEFQEDEFADMLEMTELEQANEDTK